MIYVAARAAAERYGIVEATELTQRIPSIADLLKIVWLSQTASQLYFLPSLFLIRCAALATWRLFRIRGEFLIVGGIIALCAFRLFIEPTYQEYLQPDGHDPLLHGLGGFGFFLIGAGMWRIGGNGDRLSWAWFAVPTIVAAIGSFAPQAIEYVTVQVGYLLPLYFVFARLTFGLDWLSSIGRHTMGIYLLHMPVVLKIWSVLVASLSASEPGFVWYFVVLTATFASALALTLAIHRAGLAGLFFGETPRKISPQQP